MEKLMRKNKMFFAVGAMFAGAMFTGAEFTDAVTGGVVAGWTATGGASLLDFEGVEKKFPVGLGLVHRWWRCRR